MVCSESHFGGATASPAAQDGRGGRQAAPPGPHIVALSRKDQRQHLIGFQKFFLFWVAGMIFETCDPKLERVHSFGI